MYNSLNVRALRNKRRVLWAIAARKRDYLTTNKKGFHVHKKRRKPQYTENNYLAILPHENPSLQRTSTPRDTKCTRESVRCVDGERLGGIMRFVEKVFVKMGIREF